MEEKIEYLNKLYQLAQECITPFISHSLEYIREQIDILKEDSE